MFLSHPHGFRIIQMWIFFCKAMSNVDAQQPSYPVQHSTTVNVKKYVEINLHSLLLILMVKNKYMSVCV